MFATEYQYRKTSSSLGARAVRALQADVTIIWREFDVWNVACGHVHDGAGLSPLDQLDLTGR